MRPTACKYCLDNCHCMDFSRDVEGCPCHCGCGFNAGDSIIAGLREALSWAKGEDVKVQEFVWEPRGDYGFCPNCDEVNGVIDSMELQPDGSYSGFLSMHCK